MIIFELIEELTLFLFCILLYECIQWIIFTRCVYYVFWLFSSFVNVMSFIFFCARLLTHKKQHYDTYLFTKKREKNPCRQLTDTLTHTTAYHTSSLFKTNFLSNKMLVSFFLHFWNFFTALKLSLIDVHIMMALQMILNSSKYNFKSKFEYSQWIYDVHDLVQLISFEFMSKTRFFRNFGENYFLSTFLESPFTLW